MRTVIVKAHTGMTVNFFSHCLLLHIHCPVVYHECRPQSSLCAPSIDGFIPGILRGGRPLGTVIIKGGLVERNIEVLMEFSSNVLAILTSQKTIGDVDCKIVSWPDLPPMLASLSIRP